MRRHRDWPAGDALGVAHLPRDPETWPWVEIVTSHAGARGDLVRALVAAGVHGIVVAATGNGSVHAALEAALLEARATGVTVLRATRTLGGAVIDAAPPLLASAGALTPVQARIEMLLQLMARRAA